MNINKNTPPEPKKKWVIPNVEIICTTYIAGGKHVGGPETAGFPKAFPNSSSSTQGTSHS
jgi:hypothetical protein